MYLKGFGFSIIYLSAHFLTYVRIEKSRRQNSQKFLFQGGVSVWCLAVPGDTERRSLVVFLCIEGSFKIVFGFE